MHRLFITKQKIDHEERRFTAALKGVEIDPYVDPDDEVSDLADVNRRADIKRRLILQGKNPNNYANIEEMENALELDELKDIGFGIEEN